jgi:D-tagatose-1,6-bisphosphate aldolase subunit GatZ/KbaZ
MKQFKLGYGPMSKEIIEILAKYSNNNHYPLMIIASRNQVDYIDGYVCTTAELSKQISQYKNPNLLLCRDHCGPYFGDADRGLSVEDAIEQCMKTISADIAAGFDLIHIDVSRIKDNQLFYAKKLIEYTLSLNPNIKLEFGSEDNTGIDINSSLANIDVQLGFLNPYKKNIIFFVTQTGSLTKETQSGKFDVERNKNVAEQIHNAGFLFKEHNADYFTAEDIQQRVQAGIDSLNIAPQLGKMQTDLLKEFAPVELWNKFADYVYSQNFWQRWVAPGQTDKDIAVSVSGHYCYKSYEYKDIIEEIDYEKFKEELSIRINNLIELYKKFDTKYNEEEEQFQIMLAKRLEELRKRDPFIYR